MLMSRVKAEPISAEVSARAYLDAQEHWAHRAGESIVDESPPVTRGHHEFKSDFFGRPLSRQALDALVTHVARERVPGQARELDFSSWGGAYSQPKVEATAFAHRRARFVLKHDATVAAGASNAARRAARAWAHRSWGLVHDWGTGGVFPNWADADLAQADPAYFGANADRVRSVKAHYDPEGIFGRWPSDETATVRDRERRSARPDRRITSAQERGRRGTGEAVLETLVGPSRGAGTRQIDGGRARASRPQRAPTRRFAETSTWHGRRGSSADRTPSQGNVRQLCPVIVDAKRHQTPVMMVVAFRSSGLTLQTPDSSMSRLPLTLTPLVSHPRLCGGGMPPAVPQRATWRAVAGSQI